MTYREAMRSAGRVYLFKVLEETRCDVTAAARIAGVHLATLYKLMAKCGLEVDRRFSRRALPHELFVLELTFLRLI